MIAVVYIKTLPASQIYSNEVPENWRQLILQSQGCPLSHGRCVCMAFSWIQAFDDAPLGQQVINASHHKQSGLGVGVEFRPLDFCCRVEVRQTDVRHGPVFIASLGNAFAVEQLHMGVPLVCMDARIQLADRTALTFERLQKHALTLAQHPGDSVGPIPGLRGLQDGVGHGGGLRPHRSADVNDADKHFVTPMS